MAAKVGFGHEVLNADYTAKPYFAPLMYRIILFLFIGLLFLSCTDNAHAPNVSAIDIHIAEGRFENSFFSGDSILTAAKTDSLETAYGSFLQDFLYGILNVPKQQDSALEYASNFKKAYTPLWQDASKKFADMSVYNKELIKALQYVHYYFPDYVLPASFITFIGPATGYSNILTQAGIAVGLQLYMGQDYPMYQEGYFREVYPDYLHRRFSPEYIIPDAIKNIVNEIVQPPSADHSLLAGMIDAGKKIYVAKLLLPTTADSLLIGYTAQQLKDCKAGERQIWDFFLKNNLLFESDPLRIKTYLTDGPNTAELGPGSPGNIGLFLGWQIVNKWLTSHSNTDLKDLLQKPARDMYAESKYKP